MPLPRRLDLLLLCAGLEACAQPMPSTPVAPPPPVMPPGQCSESAAQYAVGKVADAGLAEEMRVRTGARRVRMVRPGQMVTMEYDAGRLTVDLDAGDRVVRARCG